MPDPTLRLELFVDDIDRSVDFYERVLGFARGASGHAGYVPMHLHAETIALNRMADLPADHPIHAAAGAPRGRGVEIVLDVGNIDDIVARVRAAGWPLSAEPATRPWGARDFRVVDPDGYYLRITMRT